MKKILSLLSLAALTIGLLGSCSKIDERFSNLEKRIDGIESNQIASIKSQVDAINTSIADLGTIRQNVQTLMNTTPSKENIEELRKADEALGRRIDELKSYTDGELTKYATTEWVKATFATLEQHQWTCDTIAKIDARIGALDAKLSQSISGLESSLKQWVNEQLDAYYTAAQMDAKLGVMQSEIDALKEDKGKMQVDSLAKELTKTKVAVDSAKANIRSEYKAAVQSAIETSEGKLSQALKDSIAKVNDKITALDSRVTGLEIRMQAVEGRVDKLEAAIGAYTELQGTITEIIKKLLADVGDKPKDQQDTTIWKCITALQAQCGTFGTAIETLRSLVGSKDVATQISDAIASLITTQKLDGLADAVSALKDIVNGKGGVKSLTEQIADINTALSTTYVTKTQLGQDIATAKADLQKQIDSLCNVIGKDGNTTTATGIFKKIADLNAKVAALEAVKITIESTEYTKWSDAVQAVLNKVNALGIGNISGLQDALNDLDARLDKIEAMIQSVTILPAYTDGSVEAVNGILTIDFVVSPAAAVKGVTKDSIKVLVHQAKVQTKAASYTTIPVATATVDEATGDVTITADISGITPAEGKALTVAVNIKNGGISNFTTEAVPVYVAPAPAPVAPEGFVDLGVKDANGKPLFWAEKNLGASNPEDHGDYFAWGETAPYYTTTGGWPATPAWKEGKTSGYKWDSYCGQSSFVEWSTPPYDATSKILLPAYDAAAKTNSSWRTPKSDEFKALAAGCVWIWTSDYNSTGKAGYIVYKAKNNADKGKSNMNGTWKKWTGSSYSNDSATTESYSISDTHIFFPAAGFGRGTSLLSAGSDGFYWSSSLYTDDTDAAYNLGFGSGDVGPQGNSTRYFGFPVRPVTEVPATGSTIEDFNKKGDGSSNWE